MKKLKCAYCKSDFEPLNSWQKYCQESCRFKFNARKFASRPKVAPASTKTCAYCGETKDKSHFGKFGQKSRCDVCYPNRATQISTQYLIVHPEVGLLMWARGRAKRKKLPFNLELTDIQIPGICPVLGIRLERGNRGGCAASASLDRIVPELGYTKGNVHVISLRANRLKSDATPAELRLVADFFEQLDSGRTNSITKPTKASGLKAFLSSLVGTHSS